MGNLITINSADIYKKVVPILQNYQEIAGAVHFGSSLSKCRTDSDIDIGLIFDTPFFQKDRYYEKITNKIIGDLYPVNRHTFDVLSLNILPSILAFRIINTGKIFYQNDSEIVTDFIEQVSRKYAEDYPRYRKALLLIAGV